MKTPICYFLVTVFLVATTWSVRAQVLDIDGKIMYGGSYYVLPFVRGQGGGVTLAGRGDNPCPVLDVVQESSETENGLPVQFALYRMPFELIPLNQNLNIFTKTDATICMQPTYWMVQFGEKSFLTTDDISSTSFFQIQKTDDEKVYKIVFCLPGSSSCTDVGIYVDENGVRRLAVHSGNAFLVQFKEAEEDQVIETVLSKNM